MNAKQAFITGGAGGLGGPSARLLAARGWRVFVGDVPGQALESIGRESGIVALPLDVTDSTSVENAAEFVGAETGGLDAVVNFAGILRLGSVAEIPVSAFERIIDVNLLGTFRVNRALLPLLLARKGRIVNVSSETGWETVQPFSGPYAISKHAIEAYNDALRRELMFLGIDVVKIQPGPFKTDMVDELQAAFDRAVDDSIHFRELLGAIKTLALRERHKAHPPEIVAEVVHRALTATKPKLAYSIRPDAGRTLLTYLPNRLVDGILKRMLSRLATARRNAHAETTR